MKKHSGSPIKTGGAGSDAKPIPHGGDKMVGTHKQSEGTEHVGTVPSDAAKYDPHSGHKTKD